MVGPAKSHILETEIDDEMGLYDPRNETVTVLNQTASDVWRLVDGQHSLDDITRLLASSYRVPPDDISADVAETVRHFAEAGLIEPH